jgi:excisionase family DNA binding protein
VAELDEILSLSEAAEVAGLSAGRLRQLIDDGRLRGKKVGNSWAILARDLDTFLGRGRAAGRPDERKALEGRLFIDLRGNGPIQIQLAGALPDIALWFKVDNRSTLEVELDRLLVEVWLGQPIVEGSVLHRATLGPNQWNEGVRFHQYLTRDQAEEIRQRLGDSRQASNMSLRVQASAYFNTPFGTVTIFNPMIERRPGEFPVNL